MAKGKSGRSGQTRDDLSSLTTSSLRSFPVRSLLREIQDFRTFDFEPATTPARLFTGSIASIDVHAPASKPVGKNSRVQYQLAFSAPHETLVCVRRHRRREVLFAKKKAGKGGQRRPRWSKWSEYKC